MNHDEYLTNAAVESLEALDLRSARYLAEAKKEQDQLFAQLVEPFPPEMERTLTKGGTALTYIPVSEVITRLNRIFGATGWSSEIIRCERDALDPDFIVAHVRLEVRSSSFMPTRKDGFGGQKIKRTKNGDIVDLGDEFKGAISDALKKAAQQLGIGLYLARDPDAIELDDAIHSAPNSEQIAIADAYENFMSLRKKLSDEQLVELRAYWATWSGGRPVPKASEFTSEELDILTIECTRLLLDATYVVPDSEMLSND